MTRGYKLTTILFIFLLLTAGCTGEENIWRLDMSGHDEEVGNEYRFTGDVGLGGHYDDVSVEGVRVKILDAQNETLETVFVGTLNVSRSMVEINVTVERRPKYVLVLVTHIAAPDKKNAEPIAGLKRVENGDYDRYQEYSPYESVNESHLGRPPS